MNTSHITIVVYTHLFLHPPLHTYRDFYVVSSTTQCTHYKKKKTPLLATLINK